MEITELDKKVLLSNWQEEKEAALLYRQLGEKEEDEERSKIYYRLAEIEEEHARVWERELEKQGVIPEFKPGLKNRFISWIARFVENSYVLSLLEMGEGKAIEDYSDQANGLVDNQLKEDIKGILRDEKSHSRILAEMKGKPADPLSGERWHQGGDFIRDIIFGANDGLLSTFSLITGVAGGVIDNRYVLLSGLAGAVAGAISMAAGAYVSTKSEKEVQEKHLELERVELETMPEAEREELQLLYELKGLSREQAIQVSKRILEDPEIALATKAREELGFSPEELGSPGKAALFSGISFAIGSSLPILPFTFIPGRIALLFSAILSLAGFFLLGAGRAFITNRNPWHSGLEMFLIGTGAAIITYLIGSSISLLL